MQSGSQTTARIESAKIDNWHRVNYLAIVTPPHLTDRLAGHQDHSKVNDPVSLQVLLFHYRDITCDTHAQGVT